VRAPVYPDGWYKQRALNSSMRRLVVLGSVSCLLALVLPGATAIPAAISQQGTEATPPAASTTPYRATLDKYCVTCHNQKAKTANLTLDTMNLAEVPAHADVWEAVVRKLRTATMPPSGMPRPDEASSTALASWLEGELDRAARTPRPGRSMLHRLNRAEYANAIRDLLDMDVDVTPLLPSDDSAFGFDNNADLMTVSPALLERYLNAADRVSALAVGDPATTAGSETYTVRGDQSQSQHREGLPLGTVGGVAVRHYFPLDAEYEVRLTLFRTNVEAMRGLEHPHRIEIAIDGQRVFYQTVGGDAELGQTGTITDKSDATDARLRVRVPVKAGPHDVTATFLRKIGESPNRLRPFLRSNSDTYDSTGRPHIETVTVTGPFNATGAGDTPSRRRIFVCRPGAAAGAGRTASLSGRASGNMLASVQPNASSQSSPANDASEVGCARRILSTLARRAYRRPVTEPDLEPLLAFYRDGRKKGTFDTGIQLALRRLLASPTFVFRVEEDPANVAPGTAYRISDLELASRLSFFLWSSIPDAALLDTAVAGRLHDPVVLEAQVRRMLADPRANAIVENFAGQWLHIRNLQNIAPNTDEFPDFDNDLRDAFRQETELFFGSIMREDRNVLDLLRADYTFVNERLAKHYGLHDVYGSHFRRVTLSDDARRGLLGKGSILAVTSRADRTAPTLRGKWILENLLGVPPPPPPPNVPALEQTPGLQPKTMRERLDAHRANPACAGCHRLTDPLGFSLENFNAVGGWRTRDAGANVDASGALPDGTPLNGVAALRGALLKHPDAFVRTLSEKLLIYALGRGLQAYDQPVIRGIVRDAAARDYRFSSLVLGIVKSAPFQMRVKGSGVI
jgi:mono/diheme cytochrome c family protein